MGAVVIGLRVGGMFPRTEAVATGPKKVMSARTEAAVIGPPEDMSVRTAVVATGVPATKRGVAEVYPSWGNKMKTKLMKTQLFTLLASLIALTLQAQVPPAVDPSQVVSGITSCASPAPGSGG